jgi:hypothetical protein
MNQLVPCPDCSRHVRKSESLCPFCGTSLSLAQTPAPLLPSRRLGRAATFAFGATLVGAASIVGCSDGDDDGGAPVPVYGAPSAGTGATPGDAGGSGALGGADAEPNGGMTTIYGGPPSGGAGGQDQAIGGDGPINAGGEGGAMTAIYGAPPGGAGSSD